MDTEAQTLYESLINAQRYLSRVDDQIHYLKAVIDDLSGEKDVLQDCIDQHKAALSPARRLPPEIVSELLLTSVAVERGDSLHVTEGAWKLSQVCSRWRSIALSFHELWSAVIISVDVYTTRTSLDILDLWLKRSGEYPLTIEFGYPRDDPSKMQSMCRDILDSLMNHSKRWRSVELTVMSEDFLLLFPVRGNLPLLEHLSLIRVGSIHMSDHWNVHAFEVAPRLRSVMFRNIREPARIMKLPWSQIIFYRARVVSTEEHAEVLRLANNIDTCWLSCEREVPTTLEFRVGTVNLSRLRSLSYRSLAIPPVLRTPALEEVTVHCNARARETVDRVSDLVRRSQCMLKSLSLHVNLHHCDPLLQLVRLSPSLTSLHVHGYRSAAYVNDLVQSLIVSGNSRNHLLPALTKFSIQVEMRSFDHYTFADMVESRWKRPPVGVAQLRSLKFVDRDISTALGALSHLKVFQQEGLDVIIEPSWLRHRILD